MRGHSFWIVTLIICASSHTACAGPEQIRQWFDANKQSLPSNTDQLITSLSKNNEIASTILKIFGFGQETSNSTFSTPTTPRNGVKFSQRDVCPFGADPLIMSGEYSYCRPLAKGECPAGFICDMSYVLERSICCQDMRNQPKIAITMKPRTSSSTPFPMITTTKNAKSRWTGALNRRTPPWYLRNRKNGLNGVDNNDRFKTDQRTKIQKSLENTNNQRNFLHSTQRTIDHSTQKINVISSTEPSVQTTVRTTVPSTETSIGRDDVRVSVLRAGSIRQVDQQQLEIVGAITLVVDGGFRVLVDTGSSSDTELILQNLAKESVSVDEINAVVITSGHPSHIGNLNLFTHKPIIYHTKEYSGLLASLTELKDRPYRKLSDNIEIWKTPGRAQQGLSVLVHNVKNYGTVAVAGDLIPNESFIFSQPSPEVDVDESIWDSHIRRQNINLIVCLSDWIIPGYDQPFKVQPRYRQKAGCTRLLAKHKMYGRLR